MTSSAAALRAPASNREAGSAPGIAENAGCRVHEPLCAVSGGAAAAIAAAWLAEREAYRRVVRWRALYSRCRRRMRRMHPASAARLHHQLKDHEHAAIEAHEAALVRLRAAGGALLLEEGLA